ncbi:MAG TPA: hypothetical protein VIL31_06295 [Cyclobacteriaceae bacterium]|jgi:hypothetical protein
MQLKSFLIGCLSLAVATGASAQVEYDDMYFNSSDRRELKAVKGSETFALNSKKKKASKEDEFSNPTDSYSARNINPEHISRSNADEARADEQDYYITNYNQKTAAGYSAWHNQFNNWYNSPWYSTGWYSARYNPYMYSPYWTSSWYDPFYYDRFYSSWYDPFYSSWGPSWSFGWGFSYGSFYSPWRWGLSAGYGWYNSWYPRTIIIVDNDGTSRVQYGKRGTRGVASYNNSAVTNNRSRGGVVTPSYSRPNTNGRTSSSYTRPTTTGRTSGVISTSNSSQQQSSYYNKNWRSATQSTPVRSWSSGSGTRPTYDGGSYNRSSQSPTYSPAPQRSSSGGSSGYSGGSSGSSSGGSSGRTRGR